MSATTFRSRVRLKTGVRVNGRGDCEINHKHDVANRMTNALMMNLPVWGVGVQAKYGIWEQVRDTIQRIPTAVRARL